MIDLGRFPVLGTPIDAVDYEAAVEEILRAGRERRPLACAAIAVHAIMTGVHDPEYLYRLQRMQLLVPDGQPVRVALRFLHRVRLDERVYGPELMLRVCARCADARLPVFLLGSTPEVQSSLRSALSGRFPRLQIAGSRASLFRALTGREADALASEIRESGAAVTFVGLGCPRQEVWAYEFAPRTSIPAVAVGQAFELNAGLRPYPPGWMQRAGLEWMFRLLHEPRRLWKRYLLLNPEFIVRLIARGDGLDLTATQPSRELLPG